MTVTVSANFGSEIDLTALADDYAMGAAVVAGVHAREFMAIA